MNQFAYKCMSVKARTPYHHYMQLFSLLDDIYSFGKSVWQIKIWYNHADYATCNP